MYRRETPAEEGLDVLGMLSRTYKGTEYLLGEGLGIYWARNLLSTHGSYYLRLYRAYAASRNTSYSYVRLSSRSYCRRHKTRAPRPWNRSYLLASFLS